jgi:hypothetical protein
MTDSNAAGEPDASKRGLRKVKLICYIAAWLVALIATNPDGGLWALVWMFPLGLAEFVSHRTAASGGWGIFAASAGVYFVHGYFYFRSKTTRSMIFLFSVLVVLLVCNVAGCRAMINPH